ncbi:prolactin regulatory element-binding protein, partial [Phenoliferia sp. Uapishka_3]
MPPADGKPGDVIPSEPGQSTQHFKLDVQFPVYALEFTADKIVILAGGGGSSRTGVKNRLSMYAIDTTTKQFTLIKEHELSKEEDAPMSIAVNPATKAIIAGINSTEAKLKEGINENLRVFEYDDTSIKSISSHSTLLSHSPDDYQKCTSFSRPSPTSTSQFLAIGSTNSQLSLLSYPSLKPIFPPIKYDEKDEIYDVDFNDESSWVVGCSGLKVQVWSTEANGAGEGGGRMVQVIERPVGKKGVTCSFRAAK